MVALLVMAVVVVVGLCLWKTVSCLEMLKESSRYWEVEMNRGYLVSTVSLLFVRPNVLRRGVDFSRVFLPEYSFGCLYNGAKL